MTDPRVPMFEDDFALCNTCAAVLFGLYAMDHVAWHESLSDALNPKPIIWRHEPASAPAPAPEESA